MIITIKHPIGFGNEARKKIIQRFVSRLLSVTLIKISANEKRSVVLIHEPARPDIRIEISLMQGAKMQRGAIDSISASLRKYIYECIIGRYGTNSKEIVILFTFT